MVVEATLKKATILLCVMLQETIYPFMKHKYCEAHKQKLSHSLND